MVIMIVCLFCVMLVLSFIKTQFRAIAIAASGSFIAPAFKSLAKPHHPSPGMGGIAEGIAHDAASIFILLYLFYVLVLLNSWRRSKKVGNTRAALQIKYGLIGMAIVFFATFIISCSGLHHVDNELSESKAQAEYLDKYKFISDSIAKDGNNYNLYSERALLGKDFLHNSMSYNFGNDSAATSDIKKAYSLNPHDYNFVFHLFNNY